MCRALFMWGCVLLSVAYVKGANILAIIPTPSYSHQVAYQQLWRELSTRGHKVTVLTTDPVKDATLTNLTEVDLSYIYERVERKFNRVDLIGKVKESPLQLFKHIMDIQNYVLEEQLGNSLVQRLIKNPNQQTFDVIVVEFLYPAMYAFADIYKCPIITISSMDVTSSIYNIMGNPLHPAVYPDMMILQMIPPLSFTERLTSIFVSIALPWYVENVVVPRYDDSIQKHFGNYTPSLLELRKKISLVFLNIDPIFYPVKPLIPTIIPIGGGSHIRKTNEPLPKDLDDFISSAPEGVIYFSLGSNVRSENINENTLKTILEVFEELPYKIVWKFDRQYVPKTSKNLFVSKWLPQQAILQNPKVKLFITQGGCQSLDEAIYNHVPILGLPFFGDQTSNIKRMVKKGIGLSLDYTKLSKDSFKDTIVELMDNPKYRERVKKLANLARDQPMSGLQLAVWWTEYVIRHKGTPELQSPFLNLPLYQYYCLDIILFCLFVASAVVFIFVKGLRLLLSLIMYKPSSKQKTQ